MRRSNTIQKWLLAISVIILMVFVAIIIWNGSKMQGYARVINYAGRVRGASQRLIKQELAGHENDQLIAELDSILSELKTGIGENNISLIKDDNFIEVLDKQLVFWDELKEEIYITRINFDNSNVLYLLSEKYYDFADNTVDAAETYSFETSLLLKKFETLIILDSIMIFIIIFWMSYDLIRLGYKNSELNDLAYIDALTGLPNRSSCENKVEEFGLIKKNKNVCVFMFDLNNLKETNDIEGHKAGDTLIIDFAKNLRASAPDNMFVGRFGGDEFIGIISDIDEEEVISFNDKLARKIEKHNKETEHVEISYAFGYALSTNFDDITLKALLHQADNEMYLHKALIKGGSQL